MKPTQNCTVACMLVGLPLLVSSKAGLMTQHIPLLSCHTTPPAGIPPPSHRRGPCVVLSPLSSTANRNNNNLFDLGLVNAMVFLYSLCPCAQ